MSSIMKTHTHIYTHTHITAGYNKTLSIQSDTVWVSAVAKNIWDFMHLFADACKRGELTAVGHYGFNMSVSLLVFQ